MRFLFVVFILFAYCEKTFAEKRYLLYDCNPGEGFNLRRDVYIRLSNLVKALRNDEENPGLNDWVMVLPPWGRIRYHWQEQDLEQSRLPWSTFFDVPSLNRHIPVMEYEDYVEEMGEAVVDEVWYLQNYAEGWTDGKFEEKVTERPCIDTPVYESQKNKIRGWFWGYEETYAKKFKCISIQGMAKILVPLLNGGNTTARSVMLDRGENVIHDTFGGKDYWDSRRSMVFAYNLKKIADDFRKKYLDSEDEKDGTVMPKDWTKHKKPDPATVNGGPYIAAHVRRKDFLYARKDNIPSITNVAKYLKALMKKYEVEKVFIASDGTEEEMKQLEKLLPGMYRFKADKKLEKGIKKGGVAIIDQIICSHARYFIGTKESTFSFRIQDERSIIGFDHDVTFNRFCGDGEKEDCEQPSRWKVVWEDDKEMWS